MYERNAIVLERYFNQMFGYQMKNNIKTNFKDYSELVECLEKYKDISEEEETIMQEYDSIANKIREIQKKQEILNKKSNKYQEERANLFQNIDDDSNLIQKKFIQVNENIQKLEDEIKENAEQFIGIIAEFSEKTSVRMECGRARRNIENEYNTKLNETLDNYQVIDMNFVRKAKQFAELETEDIEEELKKKIEKNGEKEKIPFNIEVISKAIILTIDIQKRETEILTNIYEKTNKLFTEIKNNSVKSDKHKKNIRDSKCKIEFINSIKEYVVQFLDNERLTAVNGEEEHKKLMKEACKNLEEDFIQINNLYSLLLKEINKKVTKKSYHELYNFDYLKTLETKSEEFEAEIRKLKLSVTIINPNYWRIEGMRKIYEVFNECVTEVYGRDLSEYMPEEEREEKIEEEVADIEEKILPEEKQEETKKETKKQKKTRDSSKEDEMKAEIDKKIDMILGFDDEEEELEESEDDWSDEEEADDLEEEIEDDDFEDNYNEEDDDDDWDDDWDYDEYEESDDEDSEEEDGEFDIWGNTLKEPKEEREEEERFFEEDDEFPEEKNATNEEEDWENEFIKLERKEKNKKKKGFFDKFKK